MVTKRKVAGPSAMQPHSLPKKLKSSEDASEEANEYAATAEEKTYDNLLDYDRINMKLSTFNPRNYVGATDNKLEKLNIHKPRASYLVDNYGDRVETSKLKGKDQLWSSTHLCHHLELIDKLVTSNNTQVVSRARIEALLFRVSAMVPEGQRMTVNSEHGIGYSYYTACVGDPTSMQFVYEESSPFINVGESIIKTFVVTGVNERSLLKLRDFYVPQAVWKLYRNAKRLGKTTVRGALSDGYEWIFLILSFNEDGSASYMQSGIIPAVSTPQTPCPGLDVIAGIISHWTQKCYCDLDDEDDWFSFKTASGVDIRTINAMY